MKPPARLRIGPHTYRVRSDRGPLLAGINARGYCDTSALTIDFDGNLAASVQAETLLHEALHACLVFLDLEADVEERVSRALSPILLCLLRDNPDFLQFLTDTEERQAA